MNGKSSQVDLHVVLVEPLYPTNVGACARAIDNFDAKRLILINRHCEIDGKARRGAANAQATLEQRTEYANWDEFFAIEKEGLRIGFSARQGRLRQALEFQQYLGEHLSADLLTLDRIYLVFGREDNGLSTEDLMWLHQTCMLQTFGANTSLNLAQAVLLALSQMQTTLRAPEKTSPPRTTLLDPDDQPAISLPNSQLFEWMKLLDIEVDNRSVNAHSVLIKMLMKNIPTEKEMRNFINILEQTNRKLRERKELLARFGPLQR